MPLASNRLEEDSDQSETPKPLFGREQQVDSLVCPLGGNAILVARAARGPKPDRHSPICKEDVGIMSDAKGKVLHLKTLKTTIQHCPPLNVLTGFIPAL